MQLVLTESDSTTQHVSQQRRLVIRLIDTPTGAKVPIAQVAQVRVDQGPNTINRENVQRRIIVQANVADRDLGSVIEDVRAAITQRVQLPQGYFVQYSGQFESQEKASRQILLLSIVAIALGGIFTSTFLNMMVIPALYLKYGRAEAPSPTRDYPQNRKLAPSGD